MATLSIYVLYILVARACILVPGALLVHNVQTSGQPVKDQWSLKSPRQRVISYLSLSGQIAATAMDRELNTRQGVLMVQLGCTDLQQICSF